MEEESAARKERFARVVTESKGALGKPADLPGLDDVMPESDLLRQADLLDELRPRAIRSRPPRVGPNERSSIDVLRSRAYSAAMGVAKPLRDEIDRILDYIDAVSAAYRLAAERIAELEAEVSRLRKGSGAKE